MGTRHRSAPSAWRESAIEKISKKSLAVVACCGIVWIFYRLTGVVEFVPLCTGKTGIE
jgi:hypothetical protein